MSNEAFTWAFKQDLPMTQKFVLVALADFADENGECSPSYDGLARQVGASARTVQRAIASLIASGYITVQPRHWDDGGRAPNTYRLILTGNDGQQLEDGGALS